MHPNLSKNCPLSRPEPHGRLSLRQAAIVIGTWISLFAVGLATLP